MGLRRWLRQFIVRCREMIGWEKDYGGMYEDLDCWAYFADGTSWNWAGTPWGSPWESYRAYIEDYAVQVTVNHEGNFFDWYA